MKNNKKINLKKLKEMIRDVKKDILTISFQANTGHIGSALSIAEILSVLYLYILNINPKDRFYSLRDRFILSKGHAAVALYAVLYRIGFISKKQLMTYCKDNGLFGTHPERNLKYGIEVSTGSLGHGLSIGIGIALGLRKMKNMNNQIPKVYVLISDAELNEGSTWEAIMFASHHKLDNLIIIVDDNGMQAFGKTSEIINLQPICDKFKTFGWGTVMVDGHNIEVLLKAFKYIPILKEKPTVIITKTKIGNGISFMENKLDWHYLSLNKELYKHALKEINKL